MRSSPLPCYRSEWRCHWRSGRALRCKSPGGLPLRQYTDRGIRVGPPQGARVDGAGDHEVSAGLRTTWPGKRDVPYIKGMGSDGKPIKGRGAREEVHNRFMRYRIGVFEVEGVDEAPEPDQATRFLEVDARSILNRVNSPDLPFNWSLNPYQGCEHGCSYCYARPTHEYWGYGAGLDFERVVLVKRDAPALLAKALARAGWAAERIVISGATDPYQPIERKLGITRALLQVASDHGQPVSIITKNALVLRDLDLLAPMAADGLASVAISLTTLDEQLRARMEPRTSTAAKRLEAVAALSRAGVPVHVMVAPIVPALNEPDVAGVLRAASEAGARWAGYTVLRTNGAVAEVFETWLRAHYPDRAERVLALTRELHGGSVSDSQAGRRMRGAGTHAKQIARMFEVMRRRYFGPEAPRAVAPRRPFKVPPRGQLDLFG